MLVAVAHSNGKPPIMHAACDASWLKSEKDAIDAAVAKHGALFVRGLGLSDASQCALSFRQLADLILEKEAYAPRRSYADRVYSSTTWPAHQTMCMHNELSYRLEVPQRMLFACVVPPDDAGATPLADGAAVLSLLPASVVKRFEKL